MEGGGGMFSPRRGMRLFISQSLKRVHNYREAKAGQCGKGAGFLIFKLLLIVPIQPFSAETDGGFVL